MSEPHEQPRGPESVGSLVEEATKLVAAVSAWAREQGVDAGSGVSGLVDQALRAARGWHLDLAQTWVAGQSGDPQAHDPAAEHPADVPTGSCAWCPWCRGIDLLRHAYQTSPELRDQLGSAFAGVVQAATEYLSAQAAARTDAAPPTEDPDPAGGER